jgi:hypothetical protein
LPAQLAHLPGELALDPSDGGLAGFDQQLAVSVAADVEPQEVVAGLQRHDLGLLVVEGQPPGRQPPGQPCFDLLGLLPGVAAGHEVIALCRLPGYAERVVNVLARAVVAAPGSA